MARAQEVLQVGTPAWVDRGWMILMALGFISAFGFVTMLVVAFAGR